MPQVALTDRFCSSTKPDGVRTDFFDIIVPGLALREVWVADRTRAFRAEKRKIARARRKAGITQLEKRESAAGDAEYEAEQKLLTTVPTTLAGTYALVSHLLEIAVDGVMYEEPGSVILKTVQSALAARVSGADAAPNRKEPRSRGTTGAQSSGARHV
jgi:hypothetical protein